MNVAIFGHFSQYRAKELGFPTGWDSTTFRDNGTEVSSLSHDKGTTGQAQNLAKGREGPGQLKSGTGWARTAKIRDGTQDKTGQSRKGCSKTGNGCSKTEKDVLNQEYDVLKQEIWSFSCFRRSFSCFLCSFGSDFVPGRPGSEVFLPDHLLLPLSRDKGTPGQEFFFVPGQRDNGTYRPGLSRDVPSRGNPTRDRTE